MSPRGDAPKIIIIAVSTAGAVLLVLNVALIACYLVRRRKKKCMEEGNVLSSHVLSYPRGSHLKKSSYTLTKVQNKVKKSQNPSKIPKSDTDKTKKSEKI